MESREAPAIPADAPHRSATVLDDHMSLTLSRSAVASRRGI